VTTEKVLYHRQLVSAAPESVLPAPAQSSKSAAAATAHQPLQFVESPTKDKLNLSKGLPSHM
jgi:hypothetical protein